MCDHSLLAKPAKGGEPGLPLAQHLLETYEAARYLFGEAARWAGNYCAFFGLAGEEVSVFRRSLYLACLFHDLGKACTEFQAAMEAAMEAEADPQRPRHHQSIRHEHLSGLILHEECMWTWLEGLEGVNAHAVAAGVMGHHLKCGDADAPPGTRRWPWALRRPGTPSRVRVLADDGRLEEAWIEIAKVAGSRPPTPCTADLTWVSDAQDARPAAPWDAALDAGLDRHLEAREFDPVLLAVRAGVICADGTASALFRDEMTLETWCRGAIREPLAADTVETQVVRAKLQRLGENARLRPFQERVAASGRRALVMAPCAAGKTLAAHAWAARWLGREARGRYVFLYPTTGSTTEGFRDYMPGTTDGLARMLHSRSAHDLAGMRAACIEEHGPDAAAEAFAEVEDTYRALSLWANHAIFAATADQFLAFLSNARKGIELLPVLADAVLVLDEVHSYDARMWSALQEFLDRFDLPVLCMTATLPQTRKDALLRLGFELVADDAVTHTRPRYDIHRAETLEEGVARGLEAHEAGRRVLLVVNQVGRAQALASQLTQEGHDVLCYHSRYRRMDVSARHDAVVQAFRPNGPPVIAVTTQVCEMSLDLDADVLVTEEAPVTALVQRFGRANRHGGARLGVVYVCAPGHATDRSSSVWAPYAVDADLRGLEDFLAEVARPSVSQQALEEALTRATAARGAEQVYALFVSSGYFPLRSSFRDIRRKTECVLPQDYEAAAAAYRAKDMHWQSYILPLPYAPAHEHWPEPARGDLPRGVRILPADSGYIYDPRLGAMRSDP